MAVHEKLYHGIWQYMTVHCSILFSLPLFMAVHGCTLQYMTRFVPGRPPPILVRMWKRFIAGTTSGNCFKSLHPGPHTGLFILWHSCPSLPSGWNERPLVLGERVQVASAKAACWGQSLLLPPPLAESRLRQRQSQRRRQNQRIELYVKLHCASCVNLHLPTEPRNIE